MECNVRLVLSLGCKDPRYQHEEGDYSEPDDKTPPRRQQIHVSGRPINWIVAQCDRYFARGLGPRRYLMRHERGRRKDRTHPLAIIVRGEDVYKVVGD